MAWTKEQEAAITSRGQSLLLSAAAGSGKTAVLVERIIRRLLDKTHPLDITELLVVTFTKAAATEIAQRIGAALTAALAEKDDPAIERQLALLPAAHISTLHSFCQDVIRRYFYTIDVDPAFTIAGEEELNLLRRTVLEDIFLSYYEDDEKAAILYPLADMFGNERGDDLLMDTVSRLYDYSRSMAWPNEWLDEGAKAYDIPDDANIDDMPWCGPMKEQIRQFAADGASRYKELVEIVSQRPDLERAVPILTAEWQRLETVAQGTSWHALEKAVKAIEFQRLPGLRNLDMSDQDVWEECKKVRSDLKKTITESLQQVYFSVSEKDWLDGMKAMYPVMRGLVLLTKEFAAAYRQAKKEKGWIDFSDLEHFCLAILLDPSSTPAQPVPSPAAQELAAGFAEIMMDEYQDTNGVQELIMQLISRENNRFMVGDIKQSIYRFRLADPTLFLEKYTRFSRDEKAVERCIDLARNFRSAPNILAAINAVFQDIMTPDAAGMSYGPREMLYAGRTMPDDEHWVGGPIEAHLVLTDSEEVPETDDSEETRELTAFEKECRYIASRIVELKASGLLVARKDGSMEPLTYRHIVVLLRSMSGKAEVLLKALEEAGLPAYAEQNGGYFAAIEVQIMMALLECIDNPEQDLPMAAVLRSPIVGLTETALAELRLSGEGTFWQTLPAFIDSRKDIDEKSRLQRFYDSLEDWRTYSRRHGVADVIQRLYHDTAYYDYVGGMPGGAVRQANLQALYDRARQYEEAGFRGIFRYLQLIHKMKEDGLDLAPAKVLGEREDVVRIMSIHKSKGLEFPVVILADMTKSFNRKDMQSLLLLHNKLGIGLKQYDPVWRMMYPTCIWNGIAAQLSFESTAEEERVLYVAMTRARDKLILVGHSNRGEADWQRWRSGVNPSQAKSYFDWVMPVIAKQEGFDEIERALTVHDDWTCTKENWQVSIHAHVASPVVTEEALAEEPRLARLRAGQLTDTDIPDWLDTALSWQYAYLRAVDTAAKVSVSEIKRQYSLLHAEEIKEEQSLAVSLIENETPEAEDTFATLPPWLQEEKSVFTGAKRGTVIHKVMQYLVIKPHMTRRDIQDQLGRWERDGLFTAEEVQAVYIPAILQFCQSPLGRQLAKAVDIHREYPFTVLFTGGEYLPDIEEGERILIQGVIDCLFQEGENWILVDYKTDRLDTPEAFKERYAIQLSMYKRAVEQISHIVIRDVYIYSFHLAQAISF